MNSRPFFAFFAVGICAANVLGANPEPTDRSVETAAAIRQIEGWVEWFELRAHDMIGGKIVCADLEEIPIETLYFDGPKAEDWPALARFGEGFVPVLGENYIFVPKQGAPR